MTRPHSAIAFNSPDAAAALAALDRLGDVLEHENAALRSRDARALAALTDEKRTALAACEALVDAAAKTDESAAPTAQREALGRAKARLADLMDENEHRLRVAMIANQRLIETIAAAAQAKAVNADAYASDGRQGSPGGRTAHPLALSLNRAL